VSGQGVRGVDVEIGEKKGRFEEVVGGGGINGSAGYVVCATNELEVELVERFWCK